MTLKTYTNLLLAKRSLTKQQSEEAMEMLLETKKPDEAREFLLALTQKGETPEEVIGMISTLEKKALPLHLPYPTFDIVGTGGDLAGTINISTGSAILTAACGIPITKHGNRSISSRSGSADVLEALGVKIETPPQEIELCLKKAGIAFLFAPYYHPSLKHLSAIRKSLKSPTVFNLLGPLLNPAHAEYALIGVCSEAALELVSKVLAKLGTKKKALVFYSKGPDGMILDELTPLGSAICYEICHHERARLEIDPLSLGFSPCSISDLQGGDAITNATILEDVFKGKEGPITDTLIFNTAVALWIFGKASCIKEGILFSKKVLKEGKALEVLNNWRQFSNLQNYLDKILSDKEEEVEKLITLTKDNPSHPLNKLLKEGRSCKHLFSKALKESSLSVIAEVKRHSPSVGSIKDIKDPVELALSYCKGGASAISVLTDSKAFKGCLEDLEKVSKALTKHYPNIATLRKDFITHPLQLAEAALAGASAVLLIAYVLKDKLPFFIKEATRLGLETLTEIHDLQDLKYALDAKAPIIGINHRNLRTFEIDFSVSQMLKPLIPKECITVAESGIHSQEQAAHMKALGYDAILVGEALVRSQDPQKLLSSMKQENLSTKVKICRVTHPEDATYAAHLGADYIGIIFSKHSKYPISVSQGKEIAKAAKDAGACPVAVFVDETLEEILSICKETGISTLQLHGDISRKALPVLIKDFTIFYAIPVNLDGSISLKIEDILPSGVIPLFDYAKAGSGHSFDWIAFHPPKDRPFILAGGLNPDNVLNAIHLLHPHIVDVATGVEIKGSSRKDPTLLKTFINPVKQEKIMEHPYPFGGQFLPEILITPTEELCKDWESLKHCPSFQKELDDLLTHYAGRPTALTEIKRFSKAINGPRIFLKREDLLHTGAHKINNALGQCLIAKKRGKTRIIAETGAGQHGVATATACAHLGLECVVYMGSVDIDRQMPNVEKMKLLGASVVAVNHGAATLKDAINEALRDWAANYETSHYCLGSALGPHPYPEIVRAFQAVISLETKEQIKEFSDHPPHLLIACIGGGSNAIGFFHHFLDNPSIKLVGVEAGGKGIASGEHAARFEGGSPGVLHGCYTYLLQDKEGQILPTHSISAGLDYPAIGPDHATLYESKRVIYTSVTDPEALEAFHLLSKTEGIIPALESSHALAYIKKIAPTLSKETIVIINLSGRGDKDLKSILAAMESSHE